MTKEESSQHILTSSIENRHLVSPIAKREWISSMDERAGDSEYSIKSSLSRGKALVKNMSSLKKAFILSEILKRVID